MLPGHPRPAAEGIPVPVENVPFTLGAETIVCLSGPGSVTVTGVRPVEGTSNFQVQAFGLRPSPSKDGERLGDVKGTLGDAGLKATDTVVDAECDKPAGVGYDIGIQLAVLLCDDKSAAIERCDTTPLLDS
jgi:hypothetical protein